MDRNVFVETGNIILKIILPPVKKTHFSVEINVFCTSSFWTRDLLRRSLGDWLLRPIPNPRNVGVTSSSGPFHSPRQRTW